MLKRIKIKTQLRVLKNIKKIYEKQLSKSEENYSVYKTFENESPMKIEQSNIDYFTTNIMALTCMIEDIQYELIIQ